MNPESQEAQEGLEPQPEDRVKFWRGALEGVTRERLAREARAAVTLNDPKRAVEGAAALIARGKSPADSQQLARYCVQSLAGLHRDLERVKKIVHALARPQEGKDAGVDLDEVFDAAIKQAGTTKFEESDREWTQQRDASTRAVFEVLAGPRDAGEPSVQDLHRFTVEIQALLKAGLIGGNPDDFIDALTIVREFCPADPSSLPSVAGVEPRAFLNLGPRAKLTCVRGLARIGEHDNLRTRILHFVQSRAAEGRVELLAAVMGGLKHDDFFPCLHEALRRADTPRVEEAVVDALGRIGNPGSVDLILEHLDKCMKKHRDPAQCRRAKMLLTALGRIGRSRDLDPIARTVIVKKVIAAVDEKDAWVSLHAVNQMFSNRPEELDRASRAWAVRQCVKLLFGRDAGENLQESLRSPLGFRAPIVVALARLGREMVPEIVEEGSRYIGQYGAGFKAFAELLEKLGDERAAEVLDRMARTALLQTGEKPDATVFKDVVFDAASGGTREISRDEIVHSILYALVKIGGANGARIVLHYADQIQTGQLKSPGADTSAYLVELKREHGTLGKREAEDEPPPDLDEKEIEKAFSAAKGGLFTNQRKQIEALSILGRARRPETLGAVLASLGSKDAMTANAAETALVQFVTPPPSAKQYEAFVASLFEDEKLLRDPILQRLCDVIRRAFPKRPPYDAVYAKTVKIEVEDGALAHRLLGAARVEDSEIPAAPAADEKEKHGDDLKLVTGAKRLDDLERKRQYLQARREWVARGKPAGEEPKPPE